MPYVSQAQQRWAHTPAGQTALGGAGKVVEWDSASKGMSLPARVGTKPKVTAPARKEAKMRKPFGSFAP